MTNIQLNRTFNQMNSDALLKKVSKGGMNIREATIVATILERRFPTPLHLVKK